MQEIRSLGSEDPQEEMTTLSSILAWKIPWAEKPGGCSPWGSKESDVTQQLSTHLYLDVWTQVISLHHSHVTLCPAHSLTDTHTHTFGLFFPLRDVCSEAGSGLLLSLRVGPLAQVSAWVEIYFLNKWENDKMNRKTTKATLSDLGFLPPKL